MSYIFSEEKLYIHNIALHLMSAQDSFWIVSGVRIQRALWVYSVTQILDSVSKLDFALSSEQHPMTSILEPAF